MKRLFSLSVIIILALLAALFGSATGMAAAQTAPAGAARAWGWNDYGQLGDGSTTSRSTPAPVSGLTNVVAIAAGGNHNLVLKADGTLWAWGYNVLGQLGDGSTTNRTTPVLVSDLTNVVAVAGGAGHSLALTADGTVWAWGGNDKGQLGDGSTTDRITPVQVSSLTGVVAIAGGGDHSLALTADGTVWAWGANNFGQLGDGSTTDRITPVQVSSLTGVVAIAAGGNHNLALMADGTLWAWGANVSGELGDGTTTNRTSPVQVGSLSGVIAIAAGAAHSLAVAGPMASLSPASLSFVDQVVGTSSAPQTVTLTNSGDAPLTISKIATSGDFAQSSTCGSTLAARANCSINVTFSPTAAGSRSGTLTISDNANGSPHTVALSGNGILVADLALSLGADQNPVRSGTNLTYQVTVKNAGPTAASGVVVSEPLPAGTTFVSATPSQGSCITPAPGAIGTMTCNLGGMANGAATVKLVVKVTAAGGATLSNTASVSASSIDPNNANNAATLTTRVFGTKH